MDVPETPKITAKRELGQNFLMHRQIAERIVHVAGVHDTDVILEIGPGTGLLTRALLEKAGKVIAIEADKDLIPQLTETFGNEIQAEKLQLVQGDVRNFDPASIDGGYKLVANIPYYITGEIIRAFLTAKQKPAAMTLLVQKEVAERIARSKKESLLSLSVKVFGTPTYNFTVPKGAFRPAPKVDSAVLSITNIHSPFASEAEETLFFNVLHAGFAQKRKKLVKNLGSVLISDKVLPILSAHKLPATVRAEDVPLEVWVELTRAATNA